MFRNKDSYPYFKKDFFINHLGLADAKSNFNSE